MSLRIVPLVGIYIICWTGSLLGDENYPSWSDENVVLVPGKAQEVSLKLDSELVETYSQISANIHYNSLALSVDILTNCGGDPPYLDPADWDNDPSTDTYQQINLFCPSFSSVGRLPEGGPR